MKPGLAVGVAVFFVVVSVILVAILYGPSLLASGPNAVDSRTPIISNGVIVSENAHLGTKSWQIPTGKEASTQIQAYASATSVLPGQKLTFYVSTQSEGTVYSVNIYRLGWYQGYGGRLMSSKVYQTGRGQGYYDSANHRLVGCNSCHVDTKTGLVEANWRPSYVLTAGPDWTTGVYLAKFTDVNGMQTYVPFNVLGNSFSRYVAVTSDTTYEAYNKWGGYSLYEADGIATTGSTEESSSGKALKVSFDRPYLEGNGSGQVLLYEVDSIHWLERQGYDLSYISSVNLHEDPNQLLKHRVYLSLGHDEYWTKEMRDGVQRARNNGVGLVFLGADAAYWQMRFEPDSAEIQDRTIVCYKVATTKNNLARDPFFGGDNTRLTAEWRDPILNRPENALIGIMFSGLIHRQQGFPWQVSSQANSPLLNGTGLQPGQQYGCDLVGYEWDRVFTNGLTPTGLQVLGTSQTLQDNNTSDTSNTTYYVAPSGAMVFATGSIYWTRALDNYRYQTDKLCANRSAEVPGMQKLMANVMNAVATHYPLQRQTSVPASITFSASIQVALCAEVDCSSLKRR